MGERRLANRRGGGGVDAVSTGGAVGDDRVVRRGDKLLAGVGKERWRRAGAAGDTCCPGGDEGAASWAVFLGPGDLALAARTVRRRRGRGRSGGLALRRMATFARRA